MTNKLFIQRYILLKIISKQWSKGDSIPSEEFLGKKFNCSRLTARSAMVPFVSIGILKTTKGKGYEVVGSNDSLFLSSINDSLDFDSKKVEVIDDKKEIEKICQSAQELWIKKNWKVSDLNNIHIIKIKYFKGKKLKAVRISIINKLIVENISKEKIEESIRAMIVWNTVPDKINVIIKMQDEGYINNYAEELNWQKGNIPLITHCLYLKNGWAELSIESIIKDDFVYELSQKIIG